MTDPTTPAATNAPQNDPAPSASAPADTNQTLGVGQTGDDGVRRAPAPPSTIKSKPSDPKQAKPSVEPIPSDSGSATTPGS